MENRNKQLKMIRSSNRYNSESIDRTIMNSSEEAKQIADRIAGNITKKLKLNFNLPTRPNHHERVNL